MTTGAGGGDGTGLGLLAAPGPPGMGLGIGDGLGTGLKYAFFDRNHSWKGWSPTAGARYAMPLPSGAQVGWATIWSVMTICRAPMFCPANGATTRYEICLPYVQIIASHPPPGATAGSRQSSAGDVHALPAYSWEADGDGRLRNQIWLWMVPSRARRYFV